MDNAHSTTPLSSGPTTPPSDRLPLAVETSSSPVCELGPITEDEVEPERPVCELAPVVKKNIEPKKRAPRTAVTSNACTACRKKRRKCDGKSPCETCSRCGAVQSTIVCIYEMNARVAKSELQRENSELRRQKALSDQVFHALRSDWQVPNILRLLRDHEGLALIAKVVNSPSRESSVNSPSEVNSIASEDPLPQKYESDDYHSPETARAPSEVLYPWNSASCDEHLIKHLFSLYWTWIHPAYLLFSMEQFMEGYKTGNEEHCSAFLVAAVCAAACDLLGPHWTSASGTVSDVAALRRDFVAEAIRQEGLADREARTWLEASRVMRIVNSRSEVSCLTRATGFVQDEGG